MREGTFFRLALLRRAARQVAVARSGASLAFLLVFAGQAMEARAAAQTSEIPPSILLVTIDTLRADHVGCYGAKGAETPNLDQLAREGVRFDEARSHVPLTLPSHATILTGLLPPHHGVRANGIFPLNATVPTLATVLRAKGYSTVAIVASVVLDHAYGLSRGFDVYDDNQRVGEKTAFNYLERGASQIADVAELELARLKPPFFLWIHLYDPHRPWVAPASFRARHSGSGYDAEIAFADAALGDIRRGALERSGGNLIVAALADHGESLGEHGENQHGYTLHRGVLRVPLILAGGALPRGVVLRKAVGLVDLAPTLAEFAGASIPGADGKSLAPLWSAISSQLDPPPESAAASPEAHGRDARTRGAAQTNQVAARESASTRAQSPTHEMTLPITGAKPTVHAKKAATPGANAPAPARATAPLTAGHHASSLSTQPAPTGHPESAPSEALWEESLHPLYDSGWAPLRGLFTDRWHFVDAPRPELYDRARDPDDRKDLARVRPEIVREMKKDLAAAFTALADVQEPPIPTAVEDSPEERERREQLAALGYLSGGAHAARTTPRLDPKDGLPGFLAIERSEELLARGKTREARALVEPRTKKDPENPRLWQQLGKILGLMADMEGASRALQRAIVLDPRSDFIRYTYADILKQKGDEVGARAQLEAILKSNPRAIEASLELAALAIAKGDAARSAAVLKASYDAGGRDPDLCDRLGYFALKNGQAEQAANYFTEALSLHADDPVALLESGRGALRGGGADEAIGFFGRCRSGARAFECRMELARAYILGPGNLVLAREALSSARDIAADDAARREVDLRLKAITQMDKPN